ncbi:hypothetical protein ACLM5H_10280 [Fredinandcohnia humi]
MIFYWFTLIFCLFVVLLALIVIPWIIISIIVEEVALHKKKDTKKKKNTSFLQDFRAVMKLAGALLIFALVAISWLSKAFLI